MLTKYAYIISMQKLTNLVSSFFLFYVSAHYRFVVFPIDVEHVSGLSQVHFGTPTKLGAKWVLGSTVFSIWIIGLLHSKILLI